MSREDSTNGEARTVRILLQTTTPGAKDDWSIDAAGAVHARAVATRPLPSKPRIAISVSHPSAVMDFVVDELGGESVWRGSVGLKVGLIVDDQADAYVTASRSIKVWDTCAPAAVLLAAGGIVTSLSGAPLRYEGPASHDDGVCMWTPDAQRRLSHRVDDAVQRFRGILFPR